MAVAYRTGTTNVNFNSSGSTTPNFTAPTTVVAGDIWIITAVFKGGTGTTISGVPASFTLIKRTDQSTTVSIVSYWYKALGTETASASLGTITLSATSRWVTFIDAFSGTDNTTPVDTAHIVNGAAAAQNATTASLEAIPAGNAAYCAAGGSGTTTAPTVPTASSTGALTATGAGTKAGTQSSTVCELACGFVLGSVVLQTYSSANGSGGAAAVIHAFMVNAAAGTVSAPGFTHVHAPRTGQHRRQGLASYR